MRLSYPLILKDEKSHMFLNRELSWLAFNQRVLALAESSQVPLLERVKFLSIVNRNLDEFFMKRVGSLKQALKINLCGEVGMVWMLKDSLG